MHACIGYSLDRQKMWGYEYTHILCSTEVQTNVQHLCVHDISGAANTVWKKHGKISGETIALTGLLNQP